MNNAATHPEFNPDRSPLFAVAAVFATALTIGVAVLLPGQAATNAPGVAGIAAAPPLIDAIQPVASRAVEAQAPVQLVTLPPVEVVGTRPTTKAAANRWSVPAVYKQKS
jgi:hypothetical protein